MKRFRANRTSNKATELCLIESWKQHQSIKMPTLKHPASNRAGMALVQVVAGARDATVDAVGATVDEHELHHDTVLVAEWLWHGHEKWWYVNLYTHSVSLSLSFSLCLCISLCFCFALTFPSSLSFFSFSWPLSLAHTHIHAKRNLGIVNGMSRSVGYEFVFTSSLTTHQKVCIYSNTNPFTRSQVNPTSNKWHINTPFRRGKIMPKRRRKHTQSPPPTSATRCDIITTLKQEQTCGPAVQASSSSVRFSTLKWLVKPCSQPLPQNPSWTLSQLLKSFFLAFFLWWRIPNVITDYVGAGVASI